MFADGSQVFLGREAFQVARQAARKSLDPPDLTLLQGSRPSEVHKTVYTLLLEKEMRSYRHLRHASDRMLVEVVILHHFLKHTLQNDARTNHRTLSVLGWMIQDRLTHILLQTGSRSIKKIRELSSEPGIDRHAWETRLAGAAAEAKAMQELALTRLHVYPATVFEDTSLKIDFFLALEGSSVGACVSVKTHVNGHTKFMLGLVPGYEEWWTSIHDGSSKFEGMSRRTWRPILLTVNKPQGEDVDLTMPIHPAHWALDLQTVLEEDRSQLLTRTA